MKTLIIIQARMLADRLPRKVLLKVKEKPLLAYMLERLSYITKADQLLVATTENDHDQPIVDLCLEKEVPCFRGSEEDVLERFFLAAQEQKAESVVRLTADCPLIDPSIIDAVITYFQKEKDRYHYVSNTSPRTFPRGMDVEVFSFAALEEAYHNGTKRHEREHVTSYLYREAMKASVGNFVYEKGDFSHLRLTIDYEEDFLLLAKVIEALDHLHPFFTLEEILSLFRENPEWEKINAHLQQKPLEE